MFSLLSYTTSHCRSATIATQMSLRRHAALLIFTHSITEVARNYIVLLFLLLAEKVHRCHRMSFACSPLQFRVSFGILGPTCMSGPFFRVRVDHFQVVNKAFALVCTSTVLDHHGRIRSQRPLRSLINRPLMRLCSKVSITRRGFLRYAHLSSSALLGPRSSNIQRESFEGLSSSLCQRPHKQHLDCAPILISEPSTTSPPPNLNTGTACDE